MLPCTVGQLVNAQGYPVQCTSRGRNPVCTPSYQTLAYSSRLVQGIPCNSSKNTVWASDDPASASLHCYLLSSHPKGWPSRSSVKVPGISDKRKDYFYRTLENSEASVWGKISPISQHVGMCFGSLYLMSGCSGWFLSRCLLLDYREEPGSMTL